MGTPYVGEIRMFGGNFAPSGWAFCDGLLMSIIEYETLFSLIGTTYGGDGMTTFALPDLRGRVPLHKGTRGGLTYGMGEYGGVERVILAATQMPIHAHIARANSAGNATTPGGNVWANSPAIQFIESSGITGNMNSSALAMTGSGQPHENMIPFLGINFIISLYGDYPSA